MNFKKQLREGLLTNNPVVGQLLGMCSTMAITTTLFNGLGMGLSVTLILICSNVVISLLRKVIPDKIRIAAYIVVIAGSSPSSTFCAGLSPGPVREPRRVHPAHRRQLHHSRPRRGLRLEERRAASPLTA